MMPVRRHYMAFLLRVWRSGPRDGAVWRASLTDVDTRGRRGFPSLEALYSFLNAEAACSQDLDQERQDTAEIE